MSQQPDGGPAFPSRINDGISTRDYFAAHALTGLLANSEEIAAAADVARNRQISTSDVIATMAHVYADAMLAERAK